MPALSSVRTISHIPICMIFQHEAAARCATPFEYLHIVRALTGSDPAIRWDVVNQTRVGLFVRDVPWAAFDLDTKTKYGGDYQETGRPAVPADYKF